MPHSAESFLTSATKRQKHLCKNWRQRSERERKKGQGKNKWQNETTPERKKKKRTTAKNHSWNGTVKKSEIILNENLTKRETQYRIDQDLPN